ncbi:MAG TPA: putative glycoside hydrolase [Ktedonobacteraceae bacterium]|nr:putative glycoside hydrolase [Ktedonobacteraceae bacterium]
MSFLHPPNGQRLPCWLAGLLLLLIFSSCTPLNSSPGMTPGNTPRIDPLVDTWNNIHLFLSFDYKISNPAAVASHYDFVWGASVGGVAAFRSGNPNIFISYYMPFHRDNGTFSNSGAYHDLAYWKTVHPDWVLYKCDRVTPAYEFGNPNMPLDFANPAVLSWQIQTYAQPASESGYDGIAADNVDLQNQFGACGVYINGQWVQRYTGQLDDPRWRTDVINWLTQMQQALHHLRQPLALIPNFSIDGLSPSDPLTQQVISHIDGLEDEEGFTRYGDGYLTGSAWLQRIQLIESVQQQHKPYYIINQFPSVGHAGIQWALASYLMGKEHSAALFISTIQGYGADLRYDEYNIQIGSPKGPMYQTQNVYMRDYSHGLSIVNPSATDSYMVTLNADGHYRDVSGDLVGQTITMPPHSGMVLLTGF